MKRQPTKANWRAFAKEQARIGKAEREVIEAAVKWRIAKERHLECDEAFLPFAKWHCFQDQCRREVLLETAIDLLAAAKKRSKKP